MTDSVIYIVDDDEGVRTALAALITARGWHARAFDSASAFLAEGIAPGISRACLLIDLELNGMNGAELQEHMRNQGHTLPTIILTARPDHTNARRATAAGATVVLGKPIEADDLFQAIANAMRTG